MQLPDALAWLDAHLNRELVHGGTAGGSDGLSLSGMRQLCRQLGDPQLAYPVVHITGTNGKGSVAAMVSALLAAHGLNVGTYSSPHLTRVNERIVRNGAPIDDTELAEVLSEVALAEPLVGEPLSWFELVTAAALTWFATTAVDVAVVEVGMLGRWDATNVVDASVAVITNIGRDHTDGVGDWRATVAQETAGIIRGEGVAVLGERDQRLHGAFAAEGPRELWVVDNDFAAEAVRPAVGGVVCDLRTPTAEYPEVYVSAHGHHQADNAALAVSAVEAFFGRPTDAALLSDVLGSIHLRGRLEVVGHQPLVVIDGAHNPPAATALAETLMASFHTTGRRILVLGMLADRDAGLFLDAIEPAGIDAVVTCTVHSPRAATAAELARVVGRRGLAVEAVEDPVSAVRRAVDVADVDDLVIVAGSLYLVGAITESLGESRDA